MEQEGGVRVVQRRAGVGGAWVRGEREGLRRKGAERAYSQFSRL